MDLPTRSVGGTPSVHNLAFGNWSPRPEAAGKHDGEAGGIPARRWPGGLHQGDVRKSVEFLQIAHDQRIEGDLPDPQFAKAFAEAIHILTPVQIGIRQNSLGIVARQQVGIGNVVGMADE